MAVLGRLLISSAERLDLPDVLSIDSYAAGDWKYFLKGIVGDSKPYILKGFDVIDPQNAIGTQSCAIRVAESVVFYPGSSAGSFFHGLPEGNSNALPLVPELRKNAVNYVYLTFSTFNTSVDTRAFWDPDKDGGAGGEFTQDINTESVLQVQVNVSTGSFPANTIPVAKVTVGAVVITAIEDARDMMFRLATGGINPDPYGQYNFRSLPSTGFERAEPATTMLAPSDPNPFQGADKNIYTLKEWMDVVMTKLLELGGTTYWYEDAATFNLVQLFTDALATTLKSKGSWEHSSSTPGLLTWTDDLRIITARDPRSTIVRTGSVSLADEQVAFIAQLRDQKFNGSDQEIQWTNGQPYINTIGGAVGLFANLAQGDWVRKINDPNTYYLRVEQFYDAINLGGNPTTAANAKSVRLSGNYLGVTAQEVGRFDKGVYQAGDVQVSDRDAAALYNAGGDLLWLALREDVIENIASIQSVSLTGTVDSADGSKAHVLSVGHGLVDGDKIYVSTPIGHAGTYDVEIDDADSFYIASTSTSTGAFTGSYALCTTAARDNGYGLQLESADHGFNTDDNIIIDGTVNYDGQWAITVRSSTQFQFPLQSSFASEAAGTATLARINVRDEQSLVKVIQGESVSIGDAASNNMRQFIGMNSLAESSPTYFLPASYGTIEGTANYYSSSNDSLTARVSKLTAMMADKAMDKNVKFLPSGYDRINNTVSGANQVITFSSISGETPRLDIAMHSSLHSGTVNNSGVIMLGGSVALAQNQAAYFVVDRNNPFTVASLTNLLVANVAQVPLNENTFVFAVRFTGSDTWLWDGTRLASGVEKAAQWHTDLILKQDRNMSLIKGGTWAWDSDTNTLSWNATAYVQIPGLADAVNQINSGTAVLPSDGSIAYVKINRTSSGVSPLTVQVASNASLVMDLDTYIIARRVLNNVEIENKGAMRLIDNESMPLDSSLSDQTLELIGGTSTPITTATTDPQWATRGAPLRNIESSDKTLDAIASLDAELDKFFGQLQLKQMTSASSRVKITGADITMLNSSLISQEMVGLLMKFDGAEIDFETGSIYAADGITALGQNFTPATIALNQYRWYSVSLIPNVLDAQGRITAQVLVLPASADGASASAAPRAVFGGAKKLGQVVVQMGASSVNPIAQSQIVQLGVGSGSGGAGASPKIIGGGTFTNTVTGSSCSLAFTSDMYVEQPRLSYADNTIALANSPIVLPTVNHVAFIERLNAAAGGPALTLLVDLITNVKDGQIIIARRDGNDVIVGSSSTKLVHGESKRLYDGLSTQTKELIGAVNESSTGATYSTANGPSTANSYVADGDNLPEAIKKLDTGLDGVADTADNLQDQIDAERSPLRLTAPGTTSVNVASAFATRLNDGTTLAIPNGTLVSDFEGATINFATGNITYADLTVESFDRISFAGQASKWAKYTVVLLDDEPNRLSVIAGDSYAVLKDDAVAPSFSEGLPVGIIAVQDNGSAGLGTIQNIAQTNLTQFLAAGAGGSDSEVSRDAADGFRFLRYDDFSVKATHVDSYVNPTLTTAAYNSSKKLYEAQCDKTRTVTMSGTNFTLSGAPVGFSLAVGQIIWINSLNTWRRIATVTTSTTGTVDASFGSNPAGAACMVAEAVWTKDLVNVGSAAQKTRARDFFPTTEIPVINVSYDDSLAVADDMPDYVDTARMVVAASNYGLQTDVTTPTANFFTPIYTRPTAPNDIPNYELAEFNNTENTINLTGSYTSTLGFFVSLKRQGQAFTLASQKTVISTSWQISVGSTPSVTMNFEIIKDNGSGLPSTNPVDVVATKAFAGGTFSVGAQQNFTVTWDTPLVLPAGVYHAVMRPSADTTQITWDVTSGSPNTGTSTGYNGTNWATRAGVGYYLTVTSLIDADKQRLFLAFFPNPNNGSVTARANLLDYEVSMYEDEVISNGGILNSAYCMTDSSGTAVNCSNPTVVGGKTQVQLAFHYIPGINVNKPDGDLQVYLEGLRIPRYYAGVVGAYWKEVSGSTNVIEFHADLSGLSSSIHVVRSQGTIDTTEQNTTRLAALAEAIVGTAAQVAAGQATHTSIQTAHDAMGTEGKIILLFGSITGNVVWTKSNVTLEGKGRASVLNGNLTLNSGAVGNLIRALKVNGNVTFNSGADGNFFSDAWVGATFSLTDSGAGNQSNYIQET